jgi:hypothetical protein
MHSVKFATSAAVKVATHVTLQAVQQYSSTAMQLYRNGVCLAACATTKLATHLTLQAVQQQSSKEVQQHKSSNRSKFPHQILPRHIPLLCKPHRHLPLPYTQEQ